MTGIDLTAMPSEAARKESAAEKAVHRPRVPKRARQEGRDSMRPRIRLAMIVFTLAFVAIIGRLVSLGLTDPTTGRSSVNPNDAIATGRPDLVDRNGEVLAADIRTSSVYGEPRNIIDPDEAAAELNSSYMTPQALRDWQSQAALVCRIPNLRGHDAQMLVACRLTDPQLIANMAPGELLDRVEEYLLSEEGERVLGRCKEPDREEVTNWIRWAQQSRKLAAA